jgi:hypothetical protein
MPQGKLLQENFLRCMRMASADVQFTMTKNFANEKFEFNP